MAQGEFTKPECDHATECVKALLDGIPKSKKANFIGEANDLFLFLDAAKAKAPAEPDTALDKAARKRQV